MKFIIYGGSFNPITVSHIQVAKLALSYYDGVLYFVPSYDHSFDKTLISFRKRCLLIKQAILNIPMTYVYDTPSPKYHWDLLEDSSLDYIPKDMYVTLIGSDLLKDLPKWYNYEALINTYRFGIVVRHENDLEYLTNVSQYDIIGSVETNTSSSEVRDTIMNGGDVSGLVPQGMENMYDNIQWN
jgi:nicotinate (nicotinamide) nucleotide adenylyltransferase